MTPKLLLVCDDAGFPETNRGMRVLAEETQQPISVEHMIMQHGAIPLAQEMQRIPNISHGLHFELAGMTDAERVDIARVLQEKGLSLAESPDIRKQAIHDAREQLCLFRDSLGKNPDHISTHGNFNVTPHDLQIQQWWIDLMHEFFGDKVPPMQMANPHIRHNKYSWNKPESARPPLTPQEFLLELERMNHHPVVEFVMHPALPVRGDKGINMLFNEHMRVADLASAIRIIRSRVIQWAGFEIVSVADLPHAIAA